MKIYDSVGYFSILCKENPKYTHFKINQIKPHLRIIQAFFFKKKNKNVSLQKNNIMKRKTITLAIVALLFIDSVWCQTASLIRTYSETTDSDIHLQVYTSSSSTIQSDNLDSYEIECIYEDKK